MKTKIIIPYHFVSIIEAISSNIEKACFTVDRDGLKTCAMNRARTVYAELTLTPEYFDGFEVSEEESFCVNLGSLTAVLGAIQGWDRVGLRVEDGYFIVDVDHVWYTETFRLRVRDGKPLDVTFKKIEYDAYAKIDAIALENALGGLEEFRSYDIVTIEAGKNGLRLKVDGSESAWGDIPAWEAMIRKVEVHGTGTGHYRLSYLRDVINFVIASTVEAEFGRLAPLHLWYVFNGGRLDIYVAPMVVE